MTGMSAEDIQDAYQRRAIAEIAALNDEIIACEPCQADAELPVMSSGSPQAEIMLVKWSAGLAERQEGVAFFGRAGTAILSPVPRRSSSAASRPDIRPSASARAAPRSALRRG